MARVLLEMVGEEGRAWMPTSKASLVLLGLAGLLAQALGAGTSAAQGPEILLTLAALAALTMSQTTPRRG